MELTTAQKATLIRDHHGGFADATDAQCLAVWDALPDATRQGYAGKIKDQKEKIKDAEAAAGGTK